MQEPTRESVLISVHIALRALVIVTLPFVAILGVAAGLDLVARGGLAVLLAGATGTIGALALIWWWFPRGRKTTGPARHFPLTSRVASPHSAPRTEGVQGETRHEPGAGRPGTSAADARGDP